MSGFAPFAIAKPIPPGANDPRITPRLVILHVAVSERDSLFDYFNGPSGGVESHFYVRRDGTVEQYRSIYYQADANLRANDFAVSVETQGMGPGQWTASQLTAIKKIITWCHDTADVPYEVCRTWDGRGVGYHVMFGAPGPWTPSAKTCPGPDRIEQFKTILTPWLAKMARGPRPLFFPVKHRVVTVNLWVHNLDPLAGINRVIAKVKAAHGFPPDVIACQESHSHLGRLALVEGYRLLVNRADGEAGLELGVLLRSSLTLLGTEYHHGADGTGTGMYAHERGIFIVKYVKRGRNVAVVNTHMGLFDEVAIADGAPPDAAAIDHAEHAAKVARIVNRLRDNGFTVFVTADANARRIERPKSWARSLPRQLAAAGLHLTQNGYDLIAHDPVKVNDPAVLLIPHEVTGSDKHDAIAIRTTERNPS